MDYHRAIRQPIANMPSTSFLLVLCVSAVFAADDYVSEVAGECNSKSDLFSCGKFEVAKLISKAAHGSPSKLKLVDGIVDFVTLEKPESSETMFPSARQMSGDSEFRKFVKFVQRQVDAYLGSRAISITLPWQTRIVDAEEPNNEIVSGSDGIESRGKKKKASMLIPLIILFKLFKVKVMLALVLFGVVFIKKAIMFMVLLAPSYLQMLKICKVPHYGTPHVEEPHDFGGTGYGHGYGGHHGTYAKDWANSRAYAAYKPT